jgi:hypothetical protein
MDPIDETNNLDPGQARPPKPTDPRVMVSGRDGVRVVDPNHPSQPSNANTNHAMSSKYQFVPLQEFKLQNGSICFRCPSNLQDKSLCWVDTDTKTVWRSSVGNHVYRSPMSIATSPAC